MVTTAWLIRDKQSLQSNLVRLHVVANSDLPADQEIKLRVKDAIVSYLQEDMNLLQSAQEAKTYLQEKLPEIEAFANKVLKKYHVNQSAFVSLQKEAFDTRDYDTFSLPAGVYESLRVVIGNGAGKNWWCVVFPSLCLPATTSEFQDTAVGAGFSDGLVDTISKADGYEIRFYLLDFIGKIENLFH